tara:strand:+ start:315 stop:1073 length:759 start_codon:yes stop_codon:yes gene_type:complete
MIVLEAGINHFGKLNEANKLLSFFLKSNFKYLTFMIQTDEFYKKNKKKINFELPLAFYNKALRQAKKKNKYIGLSVCDPETYNKYLNIKFDFYKLLGIAINNKELISKLRVKKKNIYISLAKGNDKKIDNCIKYFRDKKFLRFIYTNMSYDPNDLFLKRIQYLKKKYKISTGYGHHYNNEIPIYISKVLGSEFLFIYIKNFHKKRIFYPDDTHAFFTKDLHILEKNLKTLDILLSNRKKINTKIKINEKIKF